MQKNDFKKILQAEGHSFVIGAPGTGKTHFLIRFVKYLVQEKGIPEERILVLSFNRKNAKKVREETAWALGKSIFEIPVQTIYSFCSDLIHEARLFFWEKRSLEGFHQDREDRMQWDAPGGYEDIEILTSTSQWEHLKGLLCTLDPKRFYQTHRIISSRPHVFSSFLHEVYDFILKAQENLLAPEYFFKKPVSREGLFFEVAGIYHLYEKSLKEQGLYDYGRLLSDGFYILKNFKTLREKFQSRYAAVLVDESHELNRATLQILGSFSQGHKVFFGNDDQSVFAFRNAASDHFRVLFFKTPKDRILSLETNHRNSPLINALSHAFIAQNKHRVIGGKKPSSLKGPKGEVSCKSYYNFSEETDNIIDRIQTLHHREGIPYGDMAVILKGMALQSHMIEEALLLNGIPFEKRSSRTVLEDRHVRGVTDFMRLVLLIQKTASGDACPKDRDQSSYIIKRLLLGGEDGLDPVFFQQLEKDFREGPWTDFWQFLRQEDDLKQDKVVQRFIRLVEDLSCDIDKPPFDLVSRLMIDKRYGLIRKIRQAEDSSRNGLGNFFDFLKSLRDFGDGHATIGQYLDFIDSLSESKFIEESEEGIKAGEDADCLKIISFHQCKGIEFEAVFIPFLNKDYLPSSFQLPQSYQEGLFHPKQDEERLREKHLEAERKLVYCGLTRARTFLYVTCNDSAGRSVFFKELESIIKEIKKNSLPSMLDAAKTPHGSPHKRWSVRKKAAVAQFRKDRRKWVDGQKQEALWHFLQEHYDPGRWWDLQEETVNQKAPAEGGASFSYSSLQTYSNCPFQYKARFYLGIEPEKDNLAMIIGKVYHDIIKAFYDGEDKSWAALAALIQKTIESSDFPFRFLQQEVLSKALEEFRSFYEGFYGPGPLKTVTEKRFAFDLFGDRIVGRIDLILARDKGKVEIIDFKTRAKNYTARELEEDIQLKLYSLAAEKSNDLKAFREKEMVLTYYCFSDLKNPQVSLLLDPGQKEGFQASVKNVIDHIRQEKFAPMPKEPFICSHCDYKIFCERFYGGPV